MPPRKPRVGKAMLESIDKHVSAVMDREEDKAIDEIRAYLVANKSEAKRCLVALQSGYFKTDRDFRKRKETIPESRTTIDLMSYKCLGEIITKFCPKLTQRDMLAIGKKNKFNIYWLFCFALGIPEKEPVWSHDLETFISGCQSRYLQLGQRLDQIEVQVDFEIPWKDRGAFHLAAGDDGHMYIHMLVVSRSSGIEGQ